LEKEYCYYSNLISRVFLGFNLLILEIIIGVFNLFAQGWK